jgi:PKD repeat protein
MTRRIFCKVLLVAVAIFGLLALSGVLLAQGQGVDGLERAKAAQERHTDRLMAMEGVEGTAIGFNQNDQPAVKVFTAGPGVRGIPKELDGVSVQVVVTGKIYALVDPTARFPRPVPTGVSTGHPDITAGTIGCRVTDGSNVYALSNNHVYANQNKASIGDNVLQPGRADGGKDPADAIGTLADFEPIQFARGRRVPENTIDAAIALSSTSLLGTATPAGGYGTPSSSTADATLGLSVQKYGRTTGLTEGQVYAINATVDVNYGGGNVARFVGQIIITPGSFSAGGDSGSLIVTQSGNNPVGLLFAGSSTMTVANPIDLVLSRFGVTIDDSASEPGEPQPPVANAGPDQTVSDADGDGWETVTLDGSGSDDPDGTIQSYEWDTNGDGEPDISGMIVDAAFSVGGSHTVTLTVTDNDGMTDTDNVIITVNPNQMPVADAGSDQTVSDADGDGWETVTLDGSASYDLDLDGTIQYYDWDTDGDGEPDISGMIVDAAFSVGSHTVTLTVTDNGGMTDTDGVIITVNEPTGEITVTGISPYTMPNGDYSFETTITGSGFAGGASVTFENGNGPAPKASGIVVNGDGTTIYATITLKSGGPPRDRFWDVRVTNPDGSTDVLGGGFTVTP